MIDFKPIEDFTFDDCYQSIERLNSENLVVDDILKTRYEQLFKSLKKQEQRDFNNCDSIESFEKFIKKYSSLKGASKYKTSYIDLARKEIVRLSRIRKIRKKVMVFGSIFFILLLAASIIWFGYSSYQFSIPKLDFQNNAYIISVDREGGHVSIPYVSSQDQCYIDISSDDEEISNLKITCDSISFDISSNFEENQRMSTVFVKGRDRVYGEGIGSLVNTKIDIRQNTCRATHTEPFVSTAYFKKEGSKESIEIKTNGTLYINGSKPSCDWIDINIIKVDGETYHVELNASPNYTSNKTDSIYLSIGGENKSIFVVQYGAPTYLSLEKNDIYIAGDGGDSWDENVSNGSAVISLIPHYAVDINTDGEWKVSGIPSWIKVYRQIVDIVNDEGSKLCFIVNKNTSSSKRTANIRITSKWDDDIYEDLTITQYPQ